MDNNWNERNKYQIIRKDARNCFVESKTDWFDRGQAHLEFATYDASRVEGERMTNHIHIFIDVAEFMALCEEALCGILHGRMQQAKQKGDKSALYESLGGTHAKKLAEYGKARTDGASLSRVFKLLPSGSEKSDYLLVADSGRGEANERGLIVPRFGSQPENHVAVAMSWRQLNELLLMTKLHYIAWLSARYQKLS